MQIVRGLIIFLVLCTASMPILAQNNYCAPPSPPPKPEPQEPPCPACEPKECDKCTKSPVYVGAGTYVADETDLALKTTAFGISVSRHYDSSRVFDGPFGIGWTSTLTPRLHYAVYAATPATNQYKAYIVMPHGALYEFTRTDTGAFIPPLGRRDTLVQNADQSFSLTLQDSRTVLRFNAGGTMASMTDEFGSTINYTYDANGRIQRVADGAGSGRAVDVTWNTSTGRIASVTDTAGRTIRYTYDGDGRLTGVADAVTPSGEQARRYTYVAGRFASLLSEVRDRWQRLVTKIEWDDTDRVTSYTEGEYNIANPSASTGERYTYSYFPKGDAFSTTPYTTKASSLGSKKYEYVPGTGLVTNDNTDYSSSGQVTATYSDNNERTTYTYDAQGRLTNEWMYNASNVVEDIWIYTYDTTYPEKVAERKASRYYLWPSERYEYFPAGSVAPGALKAVYRLRTDGITEDKVAEYIVDSRGRVEVVAGPIGTPSFQYVYNAAGDVTTVKRATSTTARYDYDALGRVVTSYDAANHATTYTYDDADRILTVTLPKPTATSSLNFTTTYLYDQHDAAMDLVFVHSTDPNGRVTKTGYDALGRLVKTIDALGNETTYEYQYNLLKSITDANGNRTQYGYDSERRLASTTHPDGNVESYTYTTTGRMATKTDRRGILERYAYDRYGRLRGVNYPNNPRPSGFLRGVSFSYEGSKLTSIGDTRQLDGASTAITYDAMFRPVTEQLPDGGRITYTYQYDANPAVTTYTVHPPVGSSDRETTVYYSYDTRGRVNTISFNQYTPDVRINWDPRDLYDSIELGTDVVRDYSYDNQGRLTAIANTHTTTGDVATFVYGYDYDWATSTYTMLGQRHRVDVSGHVNANQMNGLHKYRYDADYQLIQADQPNGGWTKWQYDAIGNRITHQTNSSGVVTYTYLKYGGNPNNSSRLATWTYDANGNRTGNGADWDVANRLVAYNGVDYVYDHAERRVKNGARSYVYNGLDIAREKDATANILHDYLFGPGIDEPLVRLDKNNNKHYFAMDGLGTVVAVVAGDGTVSEGARYDAWGVRVVGGASAAFGFAGREPSGPGIYYRARYYDPTVGRFLSEDPVRAHRVVESYRYVRNNPLRYIDPYGTTWWDKTFGYPKEFMNWYHQHYKPEGGPDGTKEELAEAYEVWKELGEPDVKKKKWEKKKGGNEQSDADEDASDSEAKVCLPCKLKDPWSYPTLLALVFSAGAAYTQYWCKEIVDALGKPQPCGCGK